MNKTDQQILDHVNKTNRIENKNYFTVGFLSGIATAIVLIIILGVIC